MAFDMAFIYINPLTILTGLCLGCKQQYKKALSFLSFEFSQLPQNSVNNLSTKVRFLKTSYWTVSWQSVLPHYNKFTLQSKLLKMSPKWPEMWKTRLVLF